MYTEEELNLLRVWCKGEPLPMENGVFSLEKGPDQHTEVLLEGRVSADLYEDTLATNITDSTLTVKYGTEEKDLLSFVGVIVQVEAEMVGEGDGRFYQLTVMAKSYTCLLGQQKRYRSFQKAGMTYRQLYKEVKKAYAGADFLLDPDAEGKAIPPLVLQYGEDDWDFLKRMSSQLHMPVIADSKFGSPKFIFGLPYRGEPIELKDNIHSTRRDLHTWRGQGEREGAPKMGTDYFCYEIELIGDDLGTLEIGGEVIYHGINFYVIEGKERVSDHVLTQTYRIMKKGGFWVAAQYNDKINGLSLPGKVTQVKGDKLKVQLDIDGEDGYWFTYATFYSTFFCMPEKKDQVNVYFPDHKEEDAFVINSVSRPPKRPSGTVTGAVVQPQGTSAGGPGAPPSSSGPSTKGQGGAVEEYDFETLAEKEDVKTLSTKGGNMLVLDDENDRVSVICGSTKIMLIDGVGIRISTNQGLTLDAGSEIHFLAKETILLSAKEQIEVTCGESKIDIRKESIEIKATEIKLNP